jgi:Na+-translocating ferredoxin:NAD+ oxidoreductase subunit G
MKNSYFAQGWLVIVAALLFGGGLAAVQVTLNEKIAANKLAETLDQIPHLVPGAQQGKEEEIAGQLVFRALAEGRQLGWVIQAGGPGFADRLELLIGVDVQVEKITGLYILAQKETPGLGNRIVDEWWLAQFSGKSAREALQAVKGGSAPAKEGDAITSASSWGNRIDAITGATISSESVCEIVNLALAQLRDKLIASLEKE